MPPPSATITIFRRATPGAEAWAAAGAMHRVADVKAHAIPCRRAAADRRPHGGRLFPKRIGGGQTRQNSLSCAPCCAALSLRIIPINESAGCEKPQEKAP